MVDQDAQNRLRLSVKLKKDHSELLLCEIFCNCKRTVRGIGLCAHQTPFNDIEQCDTNCRKRPVRDFPQARQQFTKRNMMYLAKGPAKVRRYYLLAAFRALSSDDIPQIACMHHRSLIFPHWRPQLVYFEISHCLDLTVIDGIIT